LSKNENIRLIAIERSAAMADKNRQKGNIKDKQRDDPKRIRTYPSGQREQGANKQYGQLHPDRLLQGEQVDPEGLQHGGSRGNSNQGND
jgi:hypothetical protein